MLKPVQASPEQQLRVLVVEDNLPDVMLIEESLREMGCAYQLTHYSDGEEAVSKLSSKNSDPSNFDVIILDINMPRISGLEVLSDLRKNEHYRSTPILVLTSSLSPAEQNEALRLGASGFVKKPSDLFGFLSEVGTKVRELVNLPDSSAE
jgi:CheY-like chemotaxis protein